MKARYFIPVLGLVVCCGGPLVTDNLLDPRHRAVPERQGTIAEPMSGPGLPDSLCTSFADTVIFFTAVEFTGNYNWRRDSIGGEFKADLILFRNLERILTLHCSEATDIDSAPDMHHIIDGHLYTECHSGTGTVIKRDGETIAVFEGKEILRGLVEKGGSVHTLSVRLDGTGFTYRKGAETVLERSGSPFGGFNDVSYGSSGALYEAGGQVCFCYHASETTTYCVRDGVENPVAIPPRTRIVRDAKAEDAGVYSVSESSGSSWLKGRDLQMKLQGGIWEDARIILEHGRLGVSGSFTGNDGIPASGVCWIPDSTETVGPEGCTVICHEGGGVGVSHTERGGIVLYENGRPAASPEGEYYFMSPRCALVCGRRKYLLLTPLEEGGECKMWTDGMEFSVKVKGFLTGMEVVVSPPS